MGARTAVCGTTLLSVASDAVNVVYASVKITVVKAIVGARTMVCATLLSACQCSECGVENYSGKVYRGCEHCFVGCKHCVLL